jgi:hypothetical protein
VFTAKRAYAAAEYEREAIKASRNDRGAFAKATVDEVEATIEGFMLHMLERPLFGDTTGKLGEITGAVTGAGTIASPWSFALANTGTNAPKGRAKYFPQGAKLDFYTIGGVYGMTAEVVNATTTAGVVTVTCTTLATGATVAPVTADVMYWEGNKDQEVVGLQSLANTGTLYGINQTTNSKFKALTKTISGALQYDDLNDAIAQLEEESEAPTLAICSNQASALIKNLSEDAKRYSAAEVKSSNAQVGFKGIEMLSDSGVFPLVASQMCPIDQIWLINQKYLQLVMREDFGWFDDDGTILLRDPNKDVYSARYGGYFELFCSKPNTVLKVSGFTV